MTCNLPTTTAVSITNAGAEMDLNGTQQTIASLSGVPGSIVTNGQKKWRKLLAGKSKK